MTDLGKIGITPKGEWASGASYERLDAVSHRGASYLAVSDTATEPAKNNTSWMLLVDGTNAEDVEGIVDNKFGELSTVAKTGVYSDLTGVPASLPANGGNADTVDGFHASQVNTAGTAVVRGADKSIQAGAVISDTDNNENPAISQVIVTNGADNYYRKASLAHLKSALRLENFNYLGVSDFKTNPSFTAVGGILANSSNYANFLRLTKNDFSYNYPNLIYFFGRGGGMVKFIFVPQHSSKDIIFVRGPIIQGGRLESLRDFDIYVVATDISGSGNGVVYDFYISKNTVYSLHFSIFGFFGLPHEIRKNAVSTSLPSGAVAATEVSYVL